ncbi:MAG: AMP-binding enzyme, partial [Myxococcota bacterium]
GEVRLLGRADDVLIVRGRNVHPAEIEGALLEIPGVEEAVVYGDDGPDGPRSLLRAVVAAPGGGVDAERVLAGCRLRLAEHKVPRRVTVVAELPRTARGKLDRAALAALAAP